MRLIEPIAVREQLHRRGWSTVEEIASKLNMSSNTISRALRGEPVRIKTVIALAKAINTGASDIAVIARKADGV